MPPFLVSVSETSPLFLSDPVWQPRSRQGQLLQMARHDTYYRGLWDLARHPWQTFRRQIVRHCLSEDSQEKQRPNYQQVRGHYWIPRKLRKSLRQGYQRTLYKMHKITIRKPAAHSTRITNIRTG